MSYFKLANCGWNLKDTGFGNRINIWEIAFELTKYNNFKFTILVDEDKWRETKYLDFPHTKSSKHLYNNFKDLPEIDIRYEWLKELDICKDWYINDAWPPYDGGSNHYGTLLHLITLKDKTLERKIKILVGDRIGIHIRHWPVVDEDSKSNFISRFDYKSKMKQVRKVMDNFPNSKFYISTNVTYDEPTQGPYLPDFRKESQWISEIYRDYDVVDYRDIISVGELLPETVRDPNNPSWSRVMDDEGKIINIVSYEEKHEDIEHEIYDIKIKRDVVDLFSLIYSRKFVPSIKTGVDSTWSDFVSHYRKRI